MFVSVNLYGTLTIVYVIKMLLTLFIHLHMQKNVKQLACAVLTYDYSSFIPECEERRGLIPRAQHGELD